MTMLKQLAKLAAATTLIGAMATAAQAEYLCSYIAEISADDMMNSSGVSLDNGPYVTTVAAYLRQDRANMHKFDFADPADGSDCYFTSAKRRGRLEDMLINGGISTDMIDHIYAGGLISVDIYSNYIDVESME